MRLFATLMLMGAVTYLPRAVPLLLLADRGLPVWAGRFLRAIPVAVLAAFVAPLVFAPQGTFDPSLDNLALLASIPTALAAVKTRSLIATVVVGVAVMMILRLVF